MTKCLFAFLAMTVGSASGITISDLQCEYLTNPLGIDVSIPRFAWKIADSGDTRGQCQTGYDLMVASRPELLAQGKADIWNSGDVASSQSTLVEFAGNKLVSGEDCYWKVGVRVKSDPNFIWSSTARFSMGLLNSNDWKGSWIKHPFAAPEKHIWFRKSFLLPERPASAFVHVASLGYHELYLNGQKADDRILAPSLTRLDKRVLYVTYDVSKLLRAGTNTIGIWYGPGWSRFKTFGEHLPQTFRLQLNASTTSGGDISISSDDTWKCQISDSENIGRYQYLDMGGEKVDARRACSDWNLASLDDSQWPSAQTTSWNASLSAQMVEPTRVLETLKPETISPGASNGVFRIDMGRNFTGWLKFKPRGLAAGDVVTIRISNTGASSEDFAQREVFVSGGTADEVFQNRFNYFGGRYLTVEGLKVRPHDSDITGYAIGTDLKRTGQFKCSSDLFNRIYETDLWTYRVNTTEGYTSDCPHRERLGYGEVASACSWGIGLPEFESGAFYANNVRDWADVQRPDGSLPHTAPQMWGAGGPMWASAGLNISRAYYDTFGDRRIYEAIYPTAIRWLEFLHRHATNEILLPYTTDRMAFLGDWATPEGKKEFGDTPEALFFNNCVYAMDMDAVVKMATVLGKHDDAELYQARQDRLKVAIQNRFFRPEAKSYSNGLQVPLAFALWQHIVPDDEIQNVIASFNQQITVNQPYLGMGSSGLPVLLHFLAEYRQWDDVVAEHLASEAKPSYGYFLKIGETAWPEYWAVDKPSRMHTCYTGISAWFIKCVAGIQPDPEKPGYQSFVIKPGIVRDLSWAEASVESPYGKISSSWKKQKDQLQIIEEIPANSTATIFIPTQDVKNLTEGHHAALSAAGLTFERSEGIYAVFHAESGRYQFASTWK